MKRIAKNWPVLALAVVATAIAVTSQAFAGPSTPAAGVTPAQVRQIAKAVANAQITARAPSLAVASARSAGAPGLYAQVSGAGVVSSNASGISQANVIHPREGIYCFVGLRNAPRGGVAILDALPPGASGANQIQVGVGTLGACPAGTQAVVGTFTPADGVLANEPFFVTFWS
jgi:hypothetical protein